MSKILDSLDIIIFVAVLATSGYFLGTGEGLGLAEKDEAVEKAELAISKVRDAVSKATYEGDEGFLILKRLMEMPTEIEEQWSPEVKSRPFKTGIFYHAVAVQDVRDERDLELRFLAPMKLEGEAEIGRIRIFWETSDRNTVDTAYFEVYRRVSDSETKIAQVDGRENSYVDTDVEAGQLYSYRVQAITEDEVLVKTNREKSGFSEAIDIRGARDYQFSLVSYDPGTKVGRVLVKRYVGDIWHEKEFDLVAGKKIGLKDVGSGIDYGTPCTVTRVEVGVEMVPEERDEVVFDGQGRVVLGLNGKPLTKHVSYQRAINIIKVFYRDELGEEVNLLLKN